MAAGRSADRRARSTSRTRSHPLLMPSRDAAQVVTIHDLNFLTHPERTRAEIRRDYPALARAHAQRADAIIVPSRVHRRRSRAAARRRRRERIAVCPPGAPDWTPRAAAADRRLRAVLRHAGAAEERRRAARRLRAARRVAARQRGRLARPELVLAGKATDEAATVARAHRAAAARRASCATSATSTRATAARCTKARGCWCCRRSRKASACRARSDDGSASRSSPPIAARCRKCSATPACWSIPTTGRRSPRAIARLLDDDALAAGCVGAGHRARRAVPLGPHRAPRLRRVRAGDRTRPARGRAADAHRHRRARALRPRDRRRPLPRRPAARVGRRTGRARGTSSCSTRRADRRCRSMRAGSRRASCRARPARGGNRCSCRARRGAITSTSASRRPTPRRCGSRVPTVVAIHDVSFVAHPEWFRLREGVAAPLADAPVGAARARAVDHDLGVLAARADRAPRTCRRAGSTSFRPGSTRARGRRAGRRIASPRALRVLFVGSIFNRRHVPDLIRAFAPIAATHADASLDIVGDNRSYPREDLSRGDRRRAAATTQVRWHRVRRPTSSSRELYAQARAFAFLSEYEGLGLTPLEALAAGVPPVLLDTPVARESCGDAALYVPAGDHRRRSTRALERAAVRRADARADARRGAGGAGEVSAGRAPRATRWRCSRRSRRRRCRI